jgi:hypothetical protein
VPILHITASKWLRSLLITAFCLIILGSMTAFVVADCRPQAGKPANQTLCSSILGGAGDQQITVEKDQTVTGAFFGDGVIGNGGSDTLINNGMTISSGGGRPATAAMMSSSTMARSLVIWMAIPRSAAVAMT